MFTDDEDFIPGPSSNLSSLFDQNFIEDGNFSLTYCAPKQPKKVQPKAKTSSEQKNIVDLLLFKIVEAYKLDNGKYQACGKAGVAVLGNEETHVYQLLLYKDKINHLCTAKINCQFKFLNQAKNYATFYDKNNQVWSVLFSNNEDVVEFSIQVALAKFNSEERSSLISQNLWLPTDVEKENKSCVGDSVEFEYIIFQQEKLNKLTQKRNGKMTAKVDSSGWEQELQNLYKGSQRLLIIPAENLGEWKKLVPNCSILFVQLTIIAIINPLLEVTMANKDSQISVDNSELSALSTDETNVLAKGETLKKTITNPKSSKANLISRMARMGQATLPVTGPSASDSDTEDDHSFHKVAKPEIKPRFHSNQNIVQTIPTAGGVVNNTQAQWPIMMYPPVVASPSDSSMSIFFSEVRTHNSELRMGITRVTDKVDNIVAKLDKTSKRDHDEALLASVDRLIHENSSLKMQLEKNYEDLQEQNRKILNILDSSRMKYEDPETIMSNKLPIPNVDHNNGVTKQLAESQCSLQNVTKQLLEVQQLNEQLNARLTSKESELANLHEQYANEFEENNRPVENYEKEIHELKMRLKNTEEEADELKIKHRKEIEELNLLINQTKNELIILKEIHEKHKSDMTIRLNDKESEIEKLRKEYDGFIAQKEVDRIVSEKNEKINNLTESVQIQDEVINSLRMKLKQSVTKPMDNSEAIKKVMNSVYKLLKSQFQQGVAYNVAEIQTVLIETIKAVTYHYLESDQSTKSETQPSTVKAILSEQEKTLQAKSLEQVGSDVVEPRLQENETSIENSDEVRNQKEISQLNSNKEDDNTDVPKQQEVKTITTEKEKTEAITNMNTSISQSSHEDPDDAWQPQPPPPPLFDEDDNEDDWFNS